MVDLSYWSIIDLLPAGANIYAKSPDTTVRMFTFGCNGSQTEILDSYDFGLFLEQGNFGEVSYNNCFPNAEGVIAYDEYVSPDPGRYTTVTAYLTLNGQNFNRITGFFTYTKPPVPTVEILSPGTVYINEEYLPLIEFGENHTPSQYEKYEPSIQWSPSKTFNTADYLGQVLQFGYAYIPVTVTATNTSGSATDATSLILLLAPSAPVLDHFLVTLDKDTIEHNGSAAITVQAQDVNNQNIDNYPFDTQLTVAFDPDNLGTVVVLPAASVASQNKDYIINGARKQKLNALKKSSDTDRDAKPARPIVLRADRLVDGRRQLAEKKPAANSPEGMDFPKSTTIKIKSSSLTASSSKTSTYGDVGRLAFVADGAEPQETQSVHFIVAKADDASKNGTASVAVRGKSGCDYVSQCSEFQMVTPPITVEPQPNGFAGETIAPCDTPNVLGGFRPIDPKNSQAIGDFELSICADKSANKLKLNIPELSVNTLLDICYKNISPRRAINDVKEIPLSDICNGEALDDLSKHSLYPVGKGNPVSKYFYLPVLFIHEDVHKSDFQLLLQEMKLQFFDVTWNIVQQVPCGQYSSLQEAQAGLRKMLQGVLGTFLRGVIIEWERKIGANQKNEVLKDQYEQATHSSLLIKVVIDGLADDIAKRKTSECH